MRSISDAVFVARKPFSTFVASVHFAFGNAALSQAIELSHGAITSPALWAGATPGQALK